MDAADGVDSSKRRNYFNSLLFKYLSTVTDELAINFLKTVGEVSVEIHCEKWENTENSLRSAHVKDK